MENLKHSCEKKTQNDQGEKQQRENIIFFWILRQQDICLHLKMLRRITFIVHMYPFHEFSHYSNIRRRTNEVK